MSEEAQGRACMPKRECFYCVQAEPRATDYITEMIDTITKIISNGHAYVLEDGDVYFDVASLPGGHTSEGHIFKA